MPLPRHLQSDCGRDVCRDPYCWDAARRAETGRWYITIGHAGFNTAANNSAGYVSRYAAINAHRDLLAKSPAVRSGNDPA